MKKCSICNEYIQLENHHCYMRPVKKGSTVENEVVNLLDNEAEDEDVTEAEYDQLLFFDFECRQENGNHEPNLCVIQNEAGDEWVFQGDNTRNEFCEWLFTEEHRGCVVMALPAGHFGHPVP